MKGIPKTIMAKAIKANSLKRTGRA